MSWWWWKKKKPAEPAISVEERIRQKYVSFRELLALNNECLELMAGLQEDLQYVPPRRDILGARVSLVYEKVRGTVGALERLTSGSYTSLREGVETQQNEVERYIAACQELTTPRLSAWLGEVGAGAVSEVGGKAACLGEIRTRLGLPVPDGYVLTTEAYRQFCGIPLWREIRNLIRGVDINDLPRLKAVAAELHNMVMAAPVPRAIEIAITERARTLFYGARGVAVRSSAVGEEGGAHTFAGQFLSLINVPPEQLVDAYKRVVASHFNERALFYRLTTGILEVESPMAVLFLPVIRAKAAGVMYTRDPNDAKSKGLWVTATRGLALEIASGRVPADLFVVSRSREHEILERNLVQQDEILAADDAGGVSRRPVLAADGASESLSASELAKLADWGLRIEEHFQAPQDVEWALGEDGALWILQARTLSLGTRARGKTPPRSEPVLTGGRTVYPGRVSGQAYLIEDPSGLANTPEGAILVVRRASPEIVEVFPRVSGVIAEWGNVTGHAASLLREFKVPAVFQMKGAFDQLRTGEPLSLDSVQAAVYRGAFWEPRNLDIALRDAWEVSSDPVSRRLLALNLVDPSAANFRVSGCKSTHDVLRYCHEKAIETMFAVNDLAMERGAGCAKKLVSQVPVHLFVLDLGRGLALDDPESAEVKPEQIVSRPFQAIWKGISHSGVSWQRNMPASFSDLASVMAGSFSSQGGVMRALGQESYLLVADEYMNLNSRLAYHFTLVDACVSEVPSNNYISFRFAGGGAARQRRNLRACLIEGCLRHFGFHVDRRGDLVNAWFRKAPAEETEANLDILGRLMACTSQLDMYMTSHAVMKWYVQQFLEGNYSFRAPEETPAEAAKPGG